jgi:hypothetical protein
VRTPTTANFLENAKLAELRVARPPMRPFANVRSRRVSNVA